MPRKLRISTGKLPALTVTRQAISKSKIAYALTANKALKYPDARSTIAYIGTTERGLKRMTETVAARADDLLTNHGINTLEVHVIQCKGKQRVKSWKSLEHALLLCFKRYYGAVPLANKIGKGSIGGWQKDLDYFNERAVIETLRKYDEPSEG